MMNHLSKIKSIIFSVSVLFIATNCNNGNPVGEMDMVCGVADPVKNLKWLKEEMKYFVGGPEINGVVLYEYSGKQVIEVQGSVFSSTNIHQYWCDGVKLDLEDPTAFKDYRDKRTEVKILYGTKMW